MKFQKFFLLIFLVTLILSFSLISFIILKRRSELSTNIVQNGSQQVTEFLNNATEWAKNYTNKHPYSPATKEGATLSQNFSDQVWIFATLIAVNWDISSNTGEITINHSGITESLPLNPETTYSFNNLAERKLDKISIRELTPGDKIQITGTDPKNSALQINVLDVKKL